MLKFDENDELFVGDEILKEFGNCTECGLCCKFFTDLPIYEEEINQTSTLLGLSGEEFKKRYTKIINASEEEIKRSLKTPCPFEKNKRCTIYTHRFFICRTYPLFMNLTTNQAILSGIYLCPQATQFYEGLLEFYKKQNYEFYEQLLKKENQITVDEKGMKIQGKATLFSPYLDWLYSKK